MTYIKLEDVRKIYNRNRYCQKISEGYTETCPNIVVDVIKINAIEEIETLPSINPEAMIREMIEELAYSYDGEINSKIGKIAIDSHIQLLKELLQKFKS